MGGNVVEGGCLSFESRSEQDVFQLPPESPSKRVCCNVCITTNTTISPELQSSPSYSSSPPLVLVAVLDKSGSMNGRKLEMVVTTMLFILDKLRDKDKLAVVVYDSSAEVLLPLTAMTETGKDRASSLLQSVAAGGCTDLSSGLQLGIGLVPPNLSSEAVASVLLLTDGLANCGLTEDAAIVEMMVCERNKTSVGSFFVNTFGFGKTHNAALLHQIAQVGEGTYYYINATDEVPVAFGDCLGGLISTVAKNTSCEIRVREDQPVVIKKVYTHKTVQEVIPG